VKVVGRERASELHTITRQFMLRRTQEVCLGDSFSKIVVVVVVAAAAVIVVVFVVSVAAVVVVVVVAVAVAVVAVSFCLF
jgi:hypothetical protein